MSAMDTPLTRRAFVSGTTLGIASTALVACTHAVEADKTETQQNDNTAVDTGPSLSTIVPFDGEHQAGIQTPAQMHANVVAFTLRAGVDARDVQRLLRVWTEDARALCSGHAPLGDLEAELDTNPASLTITCGFGARLFDIIGKQGEKPDWLRPVKSFSRDKLDPQWGDADLVLQLCADDPLILAHALRHMIRSGVDYAQTRWLQQGFLPLTRGAQRQETPRNLFGQKDGTVNPKTESDFDQQVWIDSASDPAWVQGGTCMIVRRIAMNIDEWEILDRASRELVIGRDLPEGAPLTGTQEFDTANFSQTDDYGLPVIDPMSHMARATNPDDKPREKLLRRAYSYDLPPDGQGEALSNSGLIFACFQQNPDTQFAAIQERLDQADRLNQWITHIGSAVFAVPPGTRPGEIWGEKLFNA